MKAELLFFTVLIIVGSNAKQSSLIRIDDGNWDQIQSGEWMIEFYAPWCPACRNLQTVWEEFASWGQDLGIQIAQVDITQSPGLSGRFMITALPTIYHVKEGSYRQYRGPRSKDDFLSFVEEKKWEELEPLSAWQSPSSIPMSLISQFYRVSMVLRNVMTTMVDDYGIPVWGGYLIFGVITILIGLILGLLLVCVIDFIYPPPPAHKLSARDSGKNKNQVLEKDSNKCGDDEDLEDDVPPKDRDTEDDSQLSDVEDANEDIQEEKSESEQAAHGDSTERARRRKPRRAD